MQSKSPPSPSSAGTLYVVATPIGNLSDMTLRALEVLKSVAVIACEDTRVSRVLCQHYGISTPLTPYHDHNADAATPALLARIAAGESIALISDAGTPLISDPGYPLIGQVVALGGRIVPIPGASSLTSALSASGLPTDRVYFRGFLPSKSVARQEALQHLATIDATLVLFESNHRLPESLRDCANILGEERQAVVARELTKHFEELRRDTLIGLMSHYGAQEVVRGEIVLLIAPPEKTVQEVASMRPLLAALLPHYPVKQVVSLVSETVQVSRNDLYALALAIKDEATHEP
jgi:16S rRNA (cytidine1402-2'-O)-methyltransferase